MYNYYYPKMKYLNNDVSFLYLFFENGDYVEIKRAEIINLSIKTYDNLIRSHLGFNPVIESGYIKLKISDKQKFVYSSHFLYNESLFKKNRKSYIENRCLNESRINEVWLFDENNWHKILHCETQAKMDNEFLILEFLEQPKAGHFQNENHNINVKNLKKEDIRHINLDFENCESFVVYSDEIEEINVTFDQQLEWGSSSLFRKIIGGYIKLRLDKDYSDRKNTIFNNGKKIKHADFEKRLCGKKGTSIHDICHLYIEYNHAGYGYSFKECVEIIDINLNNNDELVEDYDDMDYESYPYFEGGYAKKLKDNSIIIAFGLNAKNTIDKF